MTHLLRPYRSCLGCVTLILCLLIGPATRAQNEAPNLVRELPYPFKHVVSFSSDADELRPSHEAAIHRVFNEELGLPISDSLWPHGSRRLSSLMLGPDRVNDTASTINGHTAFGLLLREWHRGNIDQFHGWNEDSSYQLRDDVRLPLKSGSVRLAFGKTNPLIVHQQRQNLRLYFDGRAPDDLALTLEDENGERAVYDAATLVRSHIAADGYDDAIEVFMPSDKSGEADLKINAGRLRHITLDAPSCSVSCDATLIRVERDDFSRRTVEAESRLLDDLNLRPALLTSHGGTTLLQDFGVEGRVYRVSRKADPLFADPAIVMTREAKADDPDSHAYHSDLLSELGIDAVWPYFPEHPADYFLPPNAQMQARLTTSFDHFYNMPRTNTGEFDRSSADAFARDVKRILPDLSEDERKALYCGLNCDSAQGDALAMLVATSVQMIKRGTPVHHFWYTHFGSRGSDFNHTTEQPLTPVTLKWMRELANLAYNFDGKVKPDQRVWVPAASTWVRYQIMRQNLAAHLAMSADGERITITPWRDPVTRRVIPDVNAGTRDLNGLTLYVADTRKIRVFIGDDEITSFTRNDKDETGRASITLVDNHTATALIDHVPLREKGQILVESGDIVESIASQHDSVSSRILTLVADARGEADITFKPSQLEFWNISHLALALRKHAPDNSPHPALPGRIEIDFVMEDGKILSIHESDLPDTSLLPSSQWHIAPLSVSKDWQPVVLATSELDFPENAQSQNQWTRPPLPIGKVRSIRIALLNASAGARVDIADLRALRADPNGEAPDGSKLVMGRVTSDGTHGMAGVKIRAISDQSGVIKTMTDDHGYYHFAKRPKGDILSIAAIVNGQMCTIAQGRRIEIAKNETELDINANACLPVVSAATNMDAQLIP